MNQSPKKFKEVLNLDVLNFIGSICSIAALLIVVFNELNWIKGLNIIVAVIFAFCLGGTLLSVMIPWLNKQLWRSVWAKISVVMAISVGILFVLSMVFYWFYKLVDNMENLVIEIFKGM